MNIYKLDYEYTDDNGIVRIGYRAIKATTAYEAEGILYKGHKFPKTLKVLKTKKEVK